MDISSLSKNNLEQLIENYPWFTAARLEYISRCSDSGDDIVRQAVAKAGIHILSVRHFKQSIYHKAENAKISTPEESQVQPAKGQAMVEVVAKGVAKDVAKGVAKDVAKGAAKDVAKGAANQQYYIIGGDYFGQEDFKQLENDGLAVNVNLSLNPISQALGTLGNDMVDPRGSAPTENDHVEDDDIDFCTETLANIYLEQEFYSRARDVYKKLILLYPEKSTYFASLLEKIKN